MLRFLGNRSCLVLVGVLFWSLCLGGCPDQGEGHVRGERLTLSACSELGADVSLEPFHMELDFMSLSRNESVIIMSFSSSERRWPIPDLFVMTIDDGDALIEEIAAHGVASRSVQDHAMGISLSLSDTCASPLQSLRAAVGEAQFYAMGTYKQARVTGEVAFELMDMRTGDTVGESFTADFDFEVLVGTPFQSFSTPESTGAP